MKTADGAGNPRVTTMDAVAHFVEELRAAPEFVGTSVAEDFEATVEALYVEGDDNADAIAMLDAIKWILKQPRTVAEKLEVLHRLSALQGKVRINLPKFAGWA
jgi:hypothetical protein